MRDIGEHSEARDVWTYEKVTNRHYKRNSPVCQGNRVQKRH